MLLGNAHSFFCLFQTFKMILTKCSDLLCLFLTFKMIHISDRKRTDPHPASGPVSVADQGSAISSGCAATS